MLPVIAVVISAVVSLTLTPMMCSRLLRHDTGAGESWVLRFFNRLLDRIIEVYRRTLEFVLRHEKATLITTAGTLVLTIALYVIVPKGFLPVQDTGLVTAVMLAVRNQPWIDLVALGVTVLVTHLGLLFWELRYVSGSMAFPGLKPRAGRRSAAVTATQVNLTGNINSPTPDATSSVADAA